MEPFSPSARLQHGKADLRNAKNEKNRQQMKSKLATLGLGLILSALIFSGCGPGPPEPTEVPTTAPTEAATAQATETPAPAASPTPTATPPPTSTPTTTPAGEFSIHLLAQDIPPAEMSKVDLNSLRLQEQPIISIHDIMAYSKETHEIELTAPAYERIQQLFSLPVDVDGMPFVVCVGRDPVYAGAFWTPVSSLSFDGVVILQPFEANKHTITISLGYPTPEAFRGTDPRSNRRVLQALELAGKLK